MEIFNICFPFVRSEKERNQIILGWTTGNSFALRLEKIPRSVFLPVAGSTYTESQVIHARTWGKI